MGKRTWLDDSIYHRYLPALAPLADDAEGAAAAQTLLATMRQQWEQRGFKALKQQQSLMDQTRRAIKDTLGETHWSLNIIKFTTEEHTQINDEKQGRVAERNEHVQWLEDPDAIVAEAVRLLESPEWAEIAAGLSVLTGRRSSELLSTAHFEFKTQWSVLFTGALKRRGETQTLSFEIPTLTTARRVCAALEKVRRELPEAAKLPAEQVNAQYGAAVARACDRHFSGLVPLRDGKDNLYTHLSRSVYATIATFWYCPPSVNETEFKASIQGHYAVLDEQNPELRRTLAASRHYSDYEIADAVIAQHQGKRKGIKLGVAGIQSIEPFKDTTMAPALKATAAHHSRQDLRVLRYWVQDRPLLDEIFQQLNLSASDGTHQADRVGTLLRWVQQRLEGEATVQPLVEQRQTAELSNLVASPAAPPPHDDEVPQTEVAISLPATVAEGLEGKMERLLDTMNLLIQHQLQRDPPTVSTLPKTSVQSTRAAAPAKPTQDRVALEQAGGDQRAKEQREDIGKDTGTRRTKTETDDIINRAIDELIKHNSTPELPHDEKWALTINVLKLFAKSQRKIQQILAARADEIAAHHAQQQIVPATHNLRHRGKRHVTDVIQI